MITCNRCGKQVPAGLARCQNCGMPLSSAVNNSMDAQEQSELPAWLESLRALERPNVPAGGQSGFSTADLIDDDDLPGWMRAEQTRGMGEGDSNKHPAIRPASLSAPNTDAGVMRAGGFSAHDLIDQTALPSWMSPNPQSVNPAAPAVSRGANELKIYPQGYPQGVPPQQTFGGPGSPLFSASDLVDRQSLPTWMSSGQANQPAPPLNQATWQGNPPPLPPQPPVPPGSADNGQQSGLSASSLLDVNALPAWLRNGQQGQGAGNSLAAGSLVDMNALPSWLRAVDGQPQGPVGGRNAPPGTSPRIESARVPSRPRAEMMQPEQSEVAANVFSSMLGVASNTPYYPVPTFGEQQGFQNAPAQPMYAPPAYNGAPSSFASQPPAAPQSPAPGTMPGGYAGNYQNSYQNPQTPYASYPGSNQGQYMPQQNPVAAMQPGAFNGGQGVSTNQAGAKPGKRSFLDTIREWFHL